jgi:hypothetical protein
MPETSGFLNRSAKVNTHNSKSGMKINNVQKLSQNESMGAPR